MLKKCLKMAQSYKLKKYQRIILLLIIFTFLVYINRNTIIYRNIIDVIETKTTKAIIINKKEGIRRSHLTGAFSYHYEFFVDGKYYTNPSYDEEYKVGDSVKIIYSPKFPFINKIPE